MSDIIIGSARIDEKGNAVGGRAGDQKQGTSPDYKGEVSMEKFYVSKQGWNVLRAKAPEVAKIIAQKMEQACNNPHIGYNQSNRLGVIKYGIGTNIDTDCDCSSLVRECIKEASGIDVGNFTTYNEASTLTKTGAFDKFAYTNGFELKTGDILVTKTKGHTAIVVKGVDGEASQPMTSGYYPKYNGKSSDNLDDMLKAIGVSEDFIGNKVKRTPLAFVNGIVNYVGSYEQNVHLKNLACSGMLKKVRF